MPPPLISVAIAIELSRRRAPMSTKASAWLAPLTRCMNKSRMFILCPIHC